MRETLFYPAVVMADGDPAIARGFSGSKWVARGSLLAKCFFHQEKALVEALLEKV